MLVFVKLKKRNHTMNVKGEADAEMQVQMFRETESCPIGMTRDVGLRQPCLQYNFKGVEVNPLCSFREMKHRGNVHPMPACNSDSLSVSSAGYFSVTQLVTPYVLLICVY